MESTGHQAVSLLIRTGPANLRLAKKYVADLFGRVRAHDRQGGDRRVGLLQAEQLNVAHRVLKSLQTRHNLERTILQRKASRWEQ